MFFPVKRLQQLLFSKNTSLIFLLRGEAILYSVNDLYDHQTRYLSIYLGIHSFVQKARENPAGLIGGAQGSLLLLCGLGVSIVSWPYLFRDHITTQSTIAVQIRMAVGLLLLVHSVANKWVLKVRKSQKNVIYENLLS